MQNTPESEKEPNERLGFRSLLLRWAVVLLVAVGILLIPVPEGVTPQSWHRRDCSRNTEPDHRSVVVLSSVSAGDQTHAGGGRVCLQRVAPDGADEMV